MEGGNNSYRVGATTFGILAANFLFACLDQLGVPLQPNVVATGTLLLAALTNKLVSIYFK